MARQGKREVFNGLKGSGFTFKPKPPTDSWWTKAAQPQDRDAFIEAAKSRHGERTNVFTPSYANADGKLP